MSKSHLSGVAIFNMQRGHILHFSSFMCACKVEHTGNRIVEAELSCPYYVQGKIQIQDLFKYKYPKLVLLFNLDCHINSFVLTILSSSLYLPDNHIFLTSQRNDKFSHCSVCT